MTTVHAEIPDDLAKLAQEAADKEGTSFDNIVSVALAAHLGARSVRDDIEARAKRGSLGAFDRVMANVPDVPPIPGDERD